MPETRQLVVMQAVEHLFKARHFSICQIDKVLELTGATRRSEAYGQLSALHCVDYADMAPELRERLPHLVREAITPKQPKNKPSAATAVACAGLEFSA